MRHQLILLAAGAAAIATIASLGYPAPPSAPPKARYQMDVATTSGFGAGGANPMKMMFGGGRGGGSVAHTLTLRLGSTLSPTGGAPQADHFMPAGMQLGPSVPLTSPQPTPSEGMPGEMRRPKGRLLLFWGCGAHVGPGQPVVVDFAKLGQQQFPPGLFTADVPVDRGPTAATSRTYGEWPNAKSGKSAKPNSSLVGDHRVAGNYSPEIRFALDQDFMAPLSARGSEQSDGSQMLNWNSVPLATGYYAWLIGAQGSGGDNADMVWWTSASGKQFGGGLADWIAPDVVTSLIGRKIVMPPSQTSCQIPSEVKRAAGGFMMTQLYAYGPERNFAYPPRPANAKLPWKPDWTAKVRYRSNTSVMLGMPGMDDMGDNKGASDGKGGNEPAKKKCKPRITLGGFKPC
jgi:hypothetical protein